MNTSSKDRICSICQKVIQSLPTEICPGHGIGDRTIVCFDCCAELDKKDMREKGLIDLHLNPIEKEVSNWLGNLRFPVTIKESRHNWGHVRYDVWFKFEGNTWHGVKISFSGMCHCRKNTKKKRRSDGIGRHTGLKIQ